MDVGDRVKLQPHSGWNQPYRGWGERGREGVITKTFTPHGSEKVRALVRFDRQRTTTRDEVFDLSDLIPATKDT